MPSNVFKHKQPKDTGKSQGCLHVLFHHLISIICFPIKNETVIQKMTSYKPPESFLLKKANILEPSTLLSSVPQHLQGAPDTGRIYSTKVYEAAAKGHLTTYWSWPLVSILPTQKQIFLRVAVARSDSGDPECQPLWHQKIVKYLRRA